MRLSIAVAVCLSIVGVAAADPASAAIKKFTNIPAEDLGSALQELAHEHDFQVVYLSEGVDKLRTSGAVGELTAEEALKRLLKGTGLAYRYLDEKTVTVAPPSSSARKMGRTSLTDGGGQDGSREDTQKGGLWDRFRVAQVDQGASRSVGGSVAPVGTGESGKLDEIVVTGRYEFLSADTSGTTNLPLPIEKVPQSISLINEDFIKAADLKSLGEIAEYTPGAINVGNQGGYASLVKIRGFSPGLAIDGIDLQGGTTYEPDNAIYDRLEVVKGPSSVVYGVSSPGGLVNYVTKSATPSTHDYLYARAGMWNSFRLEGQIAGPLDSAGTVRAIAVAVRDQGDSFMDDIKHATTTLYAGVNFDIDTVSGYLHGGYERNVRTSFDGVPAEADGSPAPVPRSFCVCADGFNLTSNVYHGEFGLTWHPIAMWDVSLKGNSQISKTSGLAPYAYGLDSSGNVTLGFTKIDKNNIENYGIGISSIYRFDDLGLHNSFISASVLGQDDKQPALGSTFPGAPTANIFSGTPGVSAAFNQFFTVPLTPYQSSIHLKTTTESLQSYLQLIDPLSVLLGVSHSKPDAAQVSNGQAARYDAAGQTSYRVGLIYEVLPRVNAYVSYSESFLPQLYVSADGAVLPPLAGRQYETGLKYRSDDGRLLLTGAVFDIQQRNQAQYDKYDTTTGLTYFKAIGQVTHKGLELSALGKITSEWQLNAGYSYLSPKVTRDSNAAIIGQTELFLPKQTASIYSSYELSTGVIHGLSFGGGARYVGSQRTAYDESTKDLPGYVLLDTSVSYSIDKWIVQMNAHNLINKHYYINNYQTLFFGNAVGEPFNVSLSVRKTF